MPKCVCVSVMETFFIFYGGSGEIHVHKSRTHTPRSDGVPLSGESPARRDLKAPRQSHRVDARRDFSRRPHRPCWVRGRNSDLGLVIDIAQLLLSNVRMREMCWHGDLTQSRCAQQKPLNRDCPRQAGAFDDSLDGRS